MVAVSAEISPMEYAQSLDISKFSNTFQQDSAPSGLEIGVRVIWKRADDQNGPFARFSDGG